MKLKFKDYFSSHADDYNKYRPCYPEALFAYIASLSHRHQRAWDCGTGNGQSAIGLSDYFLEIIATDASKKQIENAIPHDGIKYQVATAEQSNMPSNSVDLVAVAQAFHWFDQKAFAVEANRVLKKKGIVAIWTYNLLSVNEEMDQLIHHLYETVLAKYWAPERAMVENGYSGVRLLCESKPFTEIEVADFEMSAEWNLSQFIGYLCTWSAVKKFQQEQGTNPVERLYEEIKHAWGQREDRILTVKWPLSLKVWQKGISQ